MRRTARKLKARVEAITQQDASDMVITSSEMILSQEGKDPYKIATTDQVKEMINTLEGVTGAKFVHLLVKTDGDGFSFKLKYVKNDLIEEMIDRVELNKL